MTNWDLIELKDSFLLRDIPDAVIFKERYIRSRRATDSPLSIQELWNEEQHSRKVPIFGYSSDLPDGQRG